MTRLLKCPPREIKDVKEKAFQRAIYHNKEAIIPPIAGKSTRAVVNWYSFESPIDKYREKNSTSRGSSNVDLIGKDIISNHFVVCEVKFSCNINDSPEDAAKEALHYFNVIVSDADQLDNVATHHKEETLFSWTEIDPNETELWIVANADYWSYWIDGKKKAIPEFAVEDGVRKRVRCFSLDIPGYFFKEQKGDLEFYIPEIPKATVWTELIV